MLEFDELPPLSSPAELQLPFTNGQSIPIVQATSDQYMDVGKENKLDYVVVHKLHRTFHISMAPFNFIGRSVVIRGDMKAFKLGRYNYFSEGTLLKPPLNRVKTVIVAEPLSVSIGSFVYFGQRCICEAMAIGNFVVIEDNVVLGSKCMVGNGAWLKANTVVPPGQVLDPFGIYQGNPARCIGYLSEDSHTQHVTMFLESCFAAIVLC